MNRFAITITCLSILAISGCGSKDEKEPPAFNACSNTKFILDLPFSYDLSGGNRIVTPGYLDSDSSIYVHFSPFGAHFNPMTGHAYGNNKMNFVGFFTESADDLEADGQGGLAFNAGPGGILLHERRPMYYAPAETRITSINYQPSQPGLYLDDEPSWVITMSFGGIEIKLDHVGKLSPLIHGLIESKYGYSTHDYIGPTGNIFQGNDTIVALAGAEIAYPQVIAKEVVGSPGFYVGGDTAISDRPSVQIEFFVSANTSHGSEDVCPLKLLPTSRRALFQNILTNDLENLDSQLYGPWQDTAWQWRSESNACLSCSTTTSGLNGLYKDLGGWFEIGGDAISNNELVAFVPVEQGAGTAYNPSLYEHDVQTEWLILRRRNDGQPFTWEMDDLSDALTDYPAGEIVQVEDDSMLVLWRDLDQVIDNNSYQWVRYDLTDGIVTLKFGAFDSDINSVLKPDFDLAIDVHNGDDVITFSKTKISGF